MPDDKEELEDSSSYVWDNDTQLYIHHRHTSGFYHDPVAGWYYCSKDGLYYKHENGEYVPLEHDESVHIVTSEDAQAEVLLSDPGETETLLEPTGCSNDHELEHLQRPSSWVEDTLIELYLAGNSRRPSYSAEDNQMLSANGDDDADELEEGEWIPEDDFDPQEDYFDQDAPSREEEMWLAQYGQVTQSPEKTLPEIPSVDLWDWKLVCESREADNEQVARLVGRLVRRSANLHPSVASSGTLFKTAPVCEARLHLVRVRTGQVSKLQNPSPKYLATLSVYDASNPTKYWGFPDVSTTWQDPATKRKAKKVKPKTSRRLKVKEPHEVDMIEEERSSAYRDRAAERRNLHGGYGVGPGQKGTMVGLIADEHDTGSEEDATAEEALELTFGSGSYARRIMGNMGWKEGETLGKNAKGLVEPIQAVGNTGNDEADGRTSPKRLMSMMTMGIQGQLLEVTVVGCQKLKDTEWFSRQDPYVVLEYSGARHQTRTCTDGGKNAVFQEKFMFTLLEGLRDLKVAVWNSNTLSTDDFIGNATIQLQKVLSQGYDDCTWTLQTKTGRYAGEVRLILHYAGAKNQHHHGSAPSAPPYAPQVPHYSAPPSPSPYSSPPYTGPSLYPQVQYSQPQSAYPPASPYPPQPYAYPPPPSTSAYPPGPSAYPPPPPSSTYPPPPYPPQPSPYYPQGPYQGQYPPPPY
ncbi:hypothetical protein Bca4012_086632 [Brassica carinata]